jgi:hypothetical protein
MIPLKTKVITHRETLNGQKIVVPNITVRTYNFGKSMGKGDYVDVKDMQRIEAARWDVLSPKGPNPFRRLTEQDPFDWEDMAKQYTAV